jgi:hypothetical protein
MGGVLSRKHRLRIMGIIVDDGWSDGWSIMRER